MNKICIICHSPKSTFTLEHVFPAAIGGDFIINSVCKECNEKLGKNIDDPLCRYEMVTWYRTIFKIQRKGKQGARTIPNPLKGIHKDADGNEYLVTFNKKGQPESKILPKYEPPVNIEGGFTAKLTIPLEDFTNEEDIVKKYAKKFKLDPNLIRVQNKEIKAPKEINATVSAENNIFILGTLKIAYETACTYLPDYLNDPLAKVFSNILLTKSLTDNEKKLFDDFHNLRDILTPKIDAIENIQTYHHAVLITALPNEGLTCCVRIFNWTYAFRLSEKKTYLKKGHILILNDAIQQSWWMNAKSKLKKFNISLDTQYLNREQRRLLTKYGGNLFKTKDDKLPIYNSNGKVLYAHLEEYANLIFSEPHKYFQKGKEIVIPVTFKKDYIFIKSLKGNLLFPLQSVRFVYQLVFH